MTGPRRLVLALALLVSVAAAGCSSSDSDGSTATTTVPASTTTAPAKGDLAYVKEGPNPVGTRTLALDDGRRVVEWYPAAASAADGPKETFDIASLLSPALQSQIPADLRPQYEIDAHPGAAPASDGPYPVVVFSHGFAGFPEQSADLVTHLASWGFVVIAPDHVERSLSGLLGTAGKGVARRADPEVLSATLDLALADAKSDSSPLRGLLDSGSVAVIGHSAGASAAYLAAGSDPRFKAFISYSVGTPGSKDGKAPATPVPVPKIPGMVMLGTKDGIIDPSASQAVYDGMRAPKYLVKISGAGHLVFSDICLIGRDKGGLVELVHQAGLDLPKDLLRLASDGCQAGALDPTKAFGAIDHFSVAFLRHALGIDKAPVGLDEATAAKVTSATITFASDPG